VVVTPIGSACAPPAITPASISVTIGDNKSLDLKTLIITTSGALDVNSISVTAPPLSGAKAIVTAGVLTLDYQGIAFAGKEPITIRACDTFGNCSTQQIEIEVDGDITVYNGISPNGDPLNDLWIIQNIEILDETKNNKVSVYNRWGDVVWETENYDNKDRVFKGLNKSGNELPSGTYFYKIEFTSGRKTLNGYLAVKK
jgi:gliding motility-associated-like protein